MDNIIASYPSCDYYYSVKNALDKVVQVKCTGTLVPLGRTDGWICIKCSRRINYDGLSFPRARKPRVRKLK